MITNIHLEIKVLYEQTHEFLVNDSLWQEIIKVREQIPHIRLVPKVINIKLFLEEVPSSSAYVTRALRGCFLGRSVCFLSF